MSNLLLADPPMVPFQNYEVGSEIGRGSFANVYKGVHTPSRSTVAIKAVQRAKLNKKLLVNLESEITILKAMTHPHIVRLLDYQKTSAYFFLFMEYCSLGDLSFFFRKRHEISNSLPLIASMFERYPSTNENGLHEDLARHFLKQLSSALEFLRERHLIHRDIKPQNLLLCPPKRSEQEAKAAGYKGIWELPVLKLADFGFARMLPNSSLAETLCGSPLYMAPEILRYEKYNAKADLWSVGAVLYEMVIGKPPFRASNHVELLSLIEKNNDIINFPASSTVSLELRTLIRSLLKNNPVERIGFLEFFNNPVIFEEIQTENRPLDQSHLNDHMYISEYIQLRGPRPASNVGKRISHNDMDRSPAPQCRPTVQNPNIASSIPSTQFNACSHQAHSDFHHSEAPQFIPAHSGFASSSPGSSWVIQSRNLASNNKKSELMSLHNSQPSDSDYVVVEKRAVEINTLADQFAGGTKGKTISNSITRGSTFKSSGSRPKILVPERRNSISHGSSPTNALARALSMASARLFGTHASEQGGTNSLPPQFFQKLNTPLVASDERKIIKALEDLATKAKVISIFAEVKFSQLIPSGKGEELSPNTLVMVAQEAVVLYVKTLSILSRAMNNASVWWKSNSTTMASAKLIDTVQWIREKFNESLERAEYAQSRISKYPTVAEKLQIQTITSEKLIFNRAMEMSRDAAQSEAESRDLDGCQLSYGTAIWMLEALLESDEDSGTLEEDDAAIVIQFVESLSHRLAVVRKKIEVELSGQTVTPSFASS